MRQKNFDQAINYYKNSSQIREILKDSIGLIYSLNSIAEVYTQVEDEKAIEYYRKALLLINGISDLDAREFTLKNMGEYFKFKNEQDSALYYYNQALDLNSLSDNKYSRAVILTAVAEVYNKDFDCEKVAQYSKEAYGIGLEFNLLELRMKAAELLADCYGEKKDFEKAYYFKTVASDLSGQINDASIEKSIRNIQIKYESQLEKTQLANQLLEESKVNNLRNWLYGIISAAAILIGLFLAYRFRSLKNVNRLLNEKSIEIESFNEKLQHSNSALEQFVFIASHDLKEPLRTISSYTGLLKKKIGQENSPELDGLADYIVNNVKRMYQLLDDLLAYGKLTKGSEESIKRVDMNEVIQNVMKNISHLIDNSKAEINTPHLPTIKAMPYKMTQLFQNLISNGIKFNDNEKPEISIKYAKKKDYHSFSVIDNGIGISKEYQQKVFELFQRLDKSKYEGTGIGLAICDKIIQEHKGKIWVESEEGQGSIFRFTIKDNL